VLAEYDVGPHSDSCRSSAAVLRRGAGCPHTRASRDDGEESRRTRQPDVSQPVFGVLVWPGDGRNPGLVYRLSKTIMKKSRSGGRRVTVRYSR